MGIISFTEGKLQTDSLEDIVAFALDQARNWRLASQREQSPLYRQFAVLMARAWEYFATAMFQSHTKVDPASVAQALASEIPLAIAGLGSPAGDDRFAQMPEKLERFRQQKLAVDPNELIISEDGEAIVTVQDVQSALRMAALMRDSANELVHQIGKKIKATGDELSGWKDSVDSQIEAIRATVLEKLALNKPIELWQTRKSDHETREGVYLKYAQLAGIASFLAPAIIGFGIFQRWFPLSFGPDINPNVELAFKASLVVLVLTLCLWTTRLCVRYFMIEHHLALDAASRSAMTETYLGLRAEDALEVTDRAIVLNALFRPVTDGLVNDDGMPLTSAAALATAALTRTSKAS